MPPKIMTSADKAKRLKRLTPSLTEETRKLDLNTHHFDGHLLNYEELVERDKSELIEPSSFEQTLDEIVQALPHIPMVFCKPGLPDYVEPEVWKQGVKAYIEFMRRNKGHHRDGSDNIDSEDLLPRVWRFTKKMYLSGASIVFEQFANTMPGPWSGKGGHYGGSCLQGRSKRLMQIYAPIMVEGYDNEIYRACMKSDVKQLYEKGDLKLM